MARRRPEKGAPASSSKIRLQLPDRSAPDPSHETLLEIASKRGLLKQSDDAVDAVNNATSEEEADAQVGRLGEATLWSISLAALHLTFDLLVQHQYAKEISWRDIITRSLQAFGVILFLFYILHPHPNPSTLSPRLPPKYQHPLSQLLFFLGSVAAGCYLTYITNEHGYLAVMKRAPPLGCILIWFVIELDVQWAVASVVCIGMFLWWGGYSYL